MQTASKVQADRAGRLIVGSLWLLPALATAALTLWLPALRTLALSVQTAALGRAGRFAGLANYALLLHDGRYWSSWGLSGLVAVVRLVAAIAPTALVAGIGGRRLRLGARLALSVGLALSAPAGVGLLWRLAAARGALPPALQAGGILSYLALEFTAFLGLGGGLAGMARLLTPPAGRAARAVPVLAAMAAVASGLNTFALPFALGGEHQRHLTVAARIFRLGFRQLRLGQAAAAAVPLLALSVALGAGFGLLGERFGLALRPARPEEPARHSLPARAAAVAGLALAVAPLALLYLWGAGLAWLHPGRGPAEAAAELEAGLALINGNLAPLAAILFIQLPAAYLAALSLTLVRPFGRRGSSLAYVALLAGGFLPPVAAGLGLYDLTRALGLYDTLPAGGLELMAGTAALFIFRLHFRGQEARLAQVTGTGERAAIRRLVLRPSLPVVALAGAASWLVAGQCFLWPLLVWARVELLPLSLRLLVRQAQLAGEPALLAAGAWLSLSVWAAGTLLLWWPLQVLVLERLEIVAGDPPGATLTRRSA